MTATERGSRKLRTAATAAIRSRSSKRSRGAVRRARSAARSRSRRASSACRPGSRSRRNTSIIRWLCGSTSAVNVVMPCSSAIAREMGEQDRRDPVPLPRVGDEERHLGPVAAGADVGGVGDDRRRLAADRDEREAVGVVDVDATTASPRSRSGAPKKRNPIDSGERASRNSRICGLSSARTGRTWTVEPSRSTTSASRSRG